MKARAQLAAVGLVLLGCGGDWFTPNPALALEPAAPVLYAYQGEAASEPSHLGMRKMDGGAFSWTVQPGTSVSASPQTGYGGFAWAWTTLTADASGLAAGTHTDSITIVSPECDNSPVTVPVEIVVAASGEAFMRVDPAELVFTMDYLGAAPAPQSVQISNLGTGSFDWTAETTTSWIGSVLPPSDTCTAETDTVDVTLSPPPDVALGTYVGWADLTATGGNPEQRVKVTLIVDIFQGLVAHWPLDDGGQTATDVSGNGNDGTLGSTGGVDANDPSWIAGKVGNSALSFDNVDDYVDFGDVLNGVSVPFSISAWVLKWGNEQDAVIASDDNAGCYYGFKFHVAPDGTTSVQYGDGTGMGSADRRSKSSPSALTKGVWTHVAGAVRGPTDMSLYINGVDAGGAYSGTGGAMVHSADHAILGNSTPNGPYYFNGLIDEVRIYDRALTPEEIQALASMGD